MKLGSNLLVLMLLLIAVFLQVTSQYHFFYVEQFQLFQYSWQYIGDKLFLPGGLSLLISEFLVQFFIQPYAGAIISSFLLTGVGMLTRFVLKRIAPSAELFGLYVLPVLALLLIQFNFNYLLQGTVAYLLTLALFCLYIYIPKFFHRLILSVGLIPCLFWWCGATASLFVICVLVWEMTNKPSKWYLSLLTVPELLFLGWLAVSDSAVAEYRFAFLPDTYFQPLLPSPSVLYFSWIALPLVMLTAWGMRKREIGKTKKKRMIGIAVQLAFILGLSWWSIPEYQDAKTAQLKELDYYTRTQQWDKVISACEGSLKNYLYKGYLNMALAEKGELADRLFFYDQKGAQGLLVDWNKTLAPTLLLSEIYFTMGAVAMSQRMAFEAGQSVMGEGNPRCLKRLVQTNLIYGEYPVAEKYITVLENTYGYRKWAGEQRRFLYNDAAVEADPLLGGKRKNIPRKSSLANLNGILADLLSQVDENPANYEALHFAGSLCLLAKDLGTFKQIIERYYGTPSLPVLPFSFQEAVILMSEQNMDYWKRFNVSNTVIERFKAYKTLVLKNRSNKQGLPGLLKNTYGNTYWYYYVYK